MSSSSASPPPPFQRISLSISRISRRISRRLLPNSYEYAASTSSTSTCSGESYKEYEKFSEVDDISFVTEVPTPHPDFFADTQVATPHPKSLKEVQCPVTYPESLEEAQACFSQDSEILAETRVATPRPTEMFTEQDEQWPRSTTESPCGTTITSSSSQLSTFEPASIDAKSGCYEVEIMDVERETSVSSVYIDPSSVRAIRCLHNERCVSNEFGYGLGIGRIGGNMFRVQRVSSANSCSELPRVLLPGVEEREKRTGLKKLKVDLSSIGREKWAKAVVCATAGDGLPTENELRKVLEGIEEGGSVGERRGGVGGVWNELKKRLGSERGLLVLHVILRVGRPEFVDYLARIGGGLEGLCGGYVRYLRMWLRMKGEVCVPGGRICSSIGEVRGGVDELIWGVGVVLDVVQVGVGVQGWEVGEAISGLVERELKTWMKVAAEGMKDLTKRWREMDSRLRIRAMRVYARFNKVGKEVERVVEEWKLEDVWSGEVRWGNEKGSVRGSARTRKSVKKQRSKEFAVEGEVVGVFDVDGSWNVV